jgi:hypothetical protein
MILRASILLLTLALAACGGDPEETDAGPRDTGVPQDAGISDGGFVPIGSCTASTASIAVTSARHFPQGTTLPWISNPPAGGDHYQEWLRWAQRYDIIERGNYVHNEEHGGVILLYGCGIGCDDVGAALERIGRSLPKDALCQDEINARWLVARDPLLPPGVGVAAVAWGWIYTAPCLDEASLRNFIGDHYGRAPEATCFEGTRP